MTKDRVTVPTFRRDGDGENATVSIVGEWPETVQIWAPLGLWGDRRWINWKFGKDGLVGSLVKFRLTNGGATYRVTKTLEPMHVEAVLVWQRKAA